MTTRDQIVRTALSFNGRLNGHRLNCPNPFSHDLNRATEAWCGDFVTDIYKRAQIPLPPMQPGCRTGFAYCPDAVHYGRKHHATRHSWQSEPGDIVFFVKRGIVHHTAIVTAYHGGELLTISGNSGPSNVDGYRGLGGVHRRRWNAPAGHGNPEILTVINAAKVVRFGGPAHLTRPGTPLPAQPRQLMLKTPMMHGADVRAVQQALNQRGHAGLDTDGTYGPATRDAVMTWQQREHIPVDGIVGPQTRSKLGLPTTVPIPA